MIVIVLSISKRMLWVQLTFVFSIPSLFCNRSLFTQNANIIYARQYFIEAVKYFQSKQTTVLCSSHRKNVIQQTSVAVLYIKAHLLPV